MSSRERELVGATKAGARGRAIEVEKVSSLKVIAQRNTAVLRGVH